jgi:hypothetical protein
MAGNFLVSRKSRRPAAKGLAGLAMPGRFKFASVATARVDLNVLS